MTCPTAICTEIFCGAGTVSFIWHKIRERKPLIYKLTKCDIIVHKDFLAITGQERKFVTTITSRTK